MRNVLSLLLAVATVSALLFLNARGGKAYLNGQLDSCRKIVQSISYGQATCEFDAATNQVVIFNAFAPETKYTLDGQPLNTAPAQSQVAPQEQQQ